MPPLRVTTPLPSPPLRRWLIAAMGAFAVAAHAGETPGPAASTSGTYREEVKLLSDGSVAESLARQNNLNFSSVRIDGEKTNIALSALTAEQILDAVATKVPTPDLDADAVGGLLQLTSRRAYEQKVRTLRGSVAVFHDPMAGKLDPEVSLTYGRALGAKRRAGFLATLEYRQEHDADEDVDLEWTSSSGQPQEFEYGAGREFSRELNWNGTLDWKLGDKGFAFIRTETAVQSGRDDSRGVTFELPRLPATLPQGGQRVNDATLKRSIDEGRWRSSSYTLATGASHRGEAWRADLRLTHGAERDRVDMERDYQFEEEDVGLVFDRTDPQFPVVRAVDGGIPGSLSRQRLEELEIQSGEDREEDTVVAFDLTRLGLERFPGGWLKFGGKARLQRTRRAPRYEIYEAAGRGVSVADALSPATETIIDGRYSLEGFPDLRALQRLFETEPGLFRLDADKTRADTDPGNFDVRQHILASYAMASFQTGAYRWVAGARVEQTASRFTANEVLFDEAGRYEATRPTAAENDYTNVFPGVHVSRAWTSKVTVYASWTQSIRRPDYTDLVPARRISRSGRDISEGNAALRPTLYTNYDAAMDFAYRDDGSVSLELFHRDIRDPRLRRRTVLSAGPFAGYERSRPENGGRARLQGLQLTWRQELARLASWLDGVECELNYTHQRSRQVLESRRGEKLPLADRPEHEVTLQFSYERGPYYAAVEVDHVSATLDSIGGDRSEDRFNRVWNSVDLELNRKFGNGIRAFLEIDNVSESANRGYVGSLARPSYYSHRVREYRIGFKWER